MPVNTTDKTRWEENAKTVYIIDPATGLPAGSSTELAERFGVDIPDWFYIGGIAMTLDGTNPVEVDLPPDATIFEIKARGGEVYFETNGTTASATSPGYIAENTGEIVGPLSNLSSLWIFSATADTVAHIMYFRKT